MRTSHLVAALSWALSASASPIEQTESAVGPQEWQSAPQGQKILPALSESQPIDGGKRKTITYGPYTVPAGQMVTKMNMMAENPCRNCYVTAMHATLRYPDGREAKTSEGAWLHHTVLMSLTNGLMWAAGNERPTIRLNGKYKYGIDWPGAFGYTVDIMSEQKKPMTVNMAVTFEYIDKSSSMGRQYKATNMYWNQIGNPLPPTNGKATYKSFPFVSTINGKMLYAIGHMHDGGTNMNLFINGKLACNSTMFYEKGASPSHGDMGGMGMKKRDGGPHGSFGGEHIRAPGACTDFGDIKMGDIMTSEAYYDMKAHEAMTQNGKPERLMGNMRVYMGAT